MLPPFAVIFPAAGKSSRFGNKEKKPFVNLDGRAVWLRATESFVTRPEVKQCIVVVAPDDMELFKRRYAANVMFLNVRVVEGGKERFDSVARALEALSEEIAFVAVHDAVRPCVPPPRSALQLRTRCALRNPAGPGRCICPCRPTCSTAQPRQRCRIPPRSMASAAHPTIRR